MPSFNLAEPAKGPIAYACTRFNQLTDHQRVVAADNRGEVENDFSAVARW